MQNKIVEHHNTFNLPEDCYQGVHKSGVSFWNNNSPLQSILELTQKIKKNDQPNTYDILNIVINMWYDYIYNNGTGNSHLWARRTEFKKLIRKFDFTYDIIHSLEKRYSNVIVNIGRGKNFGWVRKYYEHDLELAIEHLMTDTIHYIGLIHFSEEPVFKRLSVQRKINSF
jgi:hypothetical protein